MIVDWLYFYDKNQNKPRDKPRTDLFFESRRRSRYVISIYTESTYSIFLDNT